MYFKVLKVKFRVISVIYLFSVLSTPAFGLETMRHAPNAAKLIFVSQGKVTKLSLAHNNLRPLASYNEIAPHQSTNPEQLKEHWQGYLIKNLVGRAKLDSLEDDTPISIVAQNGYVTTFSYKDVKAAKPMLAFLKDGSEISLEQGGPQIIFPLSQLPKESSYHLESWWAWYASTIFIGPLPSQLHLNSPEGMTIVDLHQHPKRKTKKMAMRFPIGKRHGQVAVHADLSYLLLSELVKGKPIQLKVRSYLGKDTLMEKGFDRYILVFAADNKALSPSYGGPVQLCSLDHPEECLYYISEIQVSKKDD